MREATEPSTKISAIHSVDNWKFILNPDTDNLEIEEPTGWNDTDIELKRDKNFHGVSIAFTNRRLELDGNGAALVKAAYDEEGVDAETIIRVILMCDDEELYSEDFTIDYSSYHETCGEQCTISVGIEQISCFQTFNNNFDKKVDLDATQAFDGTTNLSLPDWIKNEITLLPKTIRVEDKANLLESVAEIISDQPDWFPNIVSNTIAAHIAPAFPNVIYSGFGDFNVSSYPALYIGGDAGKPPYPDFPVTCNTTELSGDIKCGIKNTFVKFRLKGSATVTHSGTPNNNVLLILTAKVFRLPVGADPVTGWVIEHSHELCRVGNIGGAVNDSENFDYEVSVPLTISQGDLIYVSVHVLCGTFFQVASFTWSQDAECYVDIVADTLCEASQADVYAIYETTNKILETITNKCLKLKSAYYGRTDSEPDDYANDGCGSLRVLTSGLYIRRAEKPTFFISMKELMEGLRCIDNIGFAIEKDSNGDEQMRVEPAEEFYQDFELLKFDNVSFVEKQVVPDEIYGTISNGYVKWQPERINGLDEFLSTRDYRTTLKNAKQTLDITCKLIAAGYLIELCRQESFKDTNASDTKYDNDVFIICMKRNEAAYYGGEMIVEQGGISGAANMVDPDTVYNFRISPFRNLMRWFKSIAGAYMDYLTGKLKFSAGTGNITAEGYLTDSCALENAIAKAENEELGADDFNDTTKAVPLLHPELITFEYPMSLNDFLKVRANPYGYISYQCGTNDWFKGYIMSVKYKIGSGQASFELRNKYE